MDVTAINRKVVFYCNVVGNYSHSQGGAPVGGSRLRGQLLHTVTPRSFKVVKLLGDTRIPRLRLLIYAQRMMADEDASLIVRWVQWGEALSLCHSADTVLLVDSCKRSEGQGLNCENDTIFAFGSRAKRVHQLFQWEELCLREASSSSQTQPRTCG